MAISKKLISQNGEDLLTLFPVDSPANLTALQESEKEKKMTATSGLKCLEQLEKFNHVGLWAKTFSALLIGQGDWFSTKCKLTWKLRGTKYGRMYFQLVPSMLPTEGTGYGSLPTPRAVDGIERRNWKTIKQKVENGGDVTLTTLAKYDAKMGTTLLPTPTTMDHMDPKTDKAIEKEMTVTRPGRTQLSNLRDVVVRQPERLLPTPTVMDSSGATANMKSTQVKEGSMHSVTLSRALTMGLLPTPTNSTGGPEPEGKTGRKLITVISRGFIPTPATRDYKGGNSMDHLTRKDKSEGNSHQDQLPNFIKLATGSTSQLNPQFVAEMMGFPPNWTDLPFLITENNP